MKSNSGQVSSLIENRSDHAVVIPSLVPVASGSGERLGMEREVDLDAIMIMEDQVVEGHGISGDYVDVQDGYVCFCGAAFGTKRGLDQDPVGSLVVVRVLPVVLPEVGAEFTESDLVSDWTTTNRDPDQNEAALEPKPWQFSYDEQYRSFLEGLRRDFDPDGVFGELIDLIPPDGEEGASPKLTLEAIKSPMGKDGASPKAVLKDTKWSIEILAHIITELKRFSHGDDLAGQLLQLAEQLQDGTLTKSAGMVRLCEITEQFFPLK
ncbi:unnamed protein product [Dicrocoelium dendriticum]|nr:unnamed protein product [Dicrocoelium dendriticum]